MTAAAQIYTYTAPWLIYGMNWSHRKDKPFRLALGSFIEEYNNKVCLDRPRWLIALLRPPSVA